MIMAKDSNNNYVKIEDIKQQNSFNGVSPIKFKGSGENLENYRIYGNTIGGESVGDRTGNLFANLWKKGYIRADNGREEQIDGFICSGFFPVEYGQTYSISRNIRVGYDNIRGYRDDESFIGAGTDICDVSNPFPSAATNIGTFTVTNENVAFIRFNDSANDLDMKYMIVDGTYTKQTMPSYEPYGYRVPVTVSNGADTQTIPIYLTEQIRKVGDEAEYVDYKEQKQHRVRKNLLPMEVRSSSIPTGISVNKIGDEYSITGTNNTGSSKSIIFAYLIPLEQGTYIFNNFSSRNIVLDYYDENNNLQVFTCNSNTNVQIVITGVIQRNINVYMPVPANIEINDTILYMLRKADITDDTYEPYIEDTELDVTLPALPTLSGTNTLSVGTEIKPSKVWGRLSDPRDIEYVKDNLGNILFSKYHEVEDEPPLTFKAKKEGALKDYRIYGNTVDGESVGDVVTEGEHTGEYVVPVTVSNGTDTQTIPIYLPEQIRKVGDEAEYIDYAEQKQYIETTDGQGKYVVGLNVDFENKTFTRLADAVGLSKGTDFNNFSAFGGRRRCNVADNGTITAYYGDANYTEDGSNGQVMVYQPAFYYKVEPLKIEAQENGVGYHLRNVNYYISNYQGEGYKLHPAFYNEAGDRVDYILFGAYEGCIYDTSANAYITDDSQVMNTSEDKFSSIANVKPTSGLSQDLTRPNLETICKNRGNGWHLLDIRIASMEQLLMAIEFGTMNTQTGSGSNGIVSITDNPSYNCASITGSTASLGNTSGQAAATISDIGGTQTVETTNGKTAYSFRGDENPWGNMWKVVYGVNIWGDGTMNGGVPYICKDYNFAESKNNGNYESAGFSVPNASGYVNAFGYSENFDWLMMPSEIGGNNSLPVGDYNNVTANLNGYKIARLGGYWADGNLAGDFHWHLNNSYGYYSRNLGGRLVYMPQIEKQHIYTTDLDVTLPALPTLSGTNTLSVGTEVQPSEVYIKGKIKEIN